MKEICAATGLTDRAVRLYIEEGLVSPHKETGYSGRETIIFDEEDLAVLTRIAVLRRTGFSIPDIRAMLTDASCIPGTVRRYREALQSEISRKQEIERLLAAVDPAADGITFTDAASLADALENAAHPQELPQEDNQPGQKEIYANAARFVLAPAALLFSLTGSLAMLILMLRVLLYSDGGIKILMGGGYRFVSVFTPDRLLRFIQYVPIACLFLAAPVFLFLYIRHPKTRDIALSLGCMAAGCLLFILFPATNQFGESATLIFDFLFARMTLGLHLNAVPWGTALSVVFKYIPFLCSGFVCAGILFIGRAVSRSKDRQ